MYVYNTFSYFYVHLLVLVPYLTAQCTVMDHLKYEGLSLDNAAKCLYYTSQWYLEELLYVKYMRQPI